MRTFDTPFSTSSTGVHGDWFKNGRFLFCLFVFRERKHEKTGTIVKTLLFYILRPMQKTLNTVLKCKGVFSEMNRPNVRSMFAFFLFKDLFGFTLCVSVCLHLWMCVI